jgi:hypothetical protein
MASINKELIMSGSKATFADDAGSLTFTPQQINVDVVRTGLSAPVTDNLPSAADMYLYLTGNWVDFTCYFMYFNMTDHDVTVSSEDANISFDGPQVVTAKTARRFCITGNASAAVAKSVYSLAISD